MPVDSELGPYHQLLETDLASMASLALTLIFASGKKELAERIGRVNPPVIALETQNPKRKIRRWVFLGYPPDTKVETVSDGTHTDIRLIPSKGPSVTYSIMTKRGYGKDEKGDDHAYISRNIKVSKRVSVVSTNTQFQKIQNTGIPDTIFVGFSPQLARKLGESLGQPDGVRDLLLVSSAGR